MEGTCSSCGTTAELNEAGLCANCAGAATAPTETEGGDMGTTEGTM